MIIIKDIPDKLKINKHDNLVLPGEEKKYSPEDLKEVKNIAVSGIVIEGLNSWSGVKIHDPRGFSCYITNFEELVGKVDISRGVIQEDLWYGLKNTKDGSWMLLTAEMKSETKKAIKSVKDIKPGYVYKLFSDTLVYLGRLGWKDEYGTLRPHHTFVNPERGEITYRCWLKGSDFKEIGYDDPDLYKEAKEALSQSYQGSASIQVSSISLLPDLKYTNYCHTLLMPTEFKNLEKSKWGRSTVVFVKQVDKEHIKLVKLESSACWRHKYEDYYEPDSWYRKQKSIDVIEYEITVGDFLVSVIDGTVKRLEKRTYIDKCVDYDLINFVYLQNILKDPDYKCLDLTDKDMWERVYKFTTWQKYGDIFNCHLTNGETKKYSDIFKTSIKL